MNDLIRPSLYDAWHEIVPLAQPAAEASLRPVDVVGPICASSDTFARQRSLPPVAEGALLAFSSAGASRFVMASTHNSLTPLPEVRVPGYLPAVVAHSRHHDPIIDT